MLIFGHIGITTGVIKLCEKAINKRNPKDNKFINYRVIIIGSLLPDIIDKPLVQIIYGLENHEGHLIAHSFIFSALLIIFGIIMMRRNKNENIFLLGICSFIHQIFDKMMLLPNIFSLSSINLDHFIPWGRLGFIHGIVILIYTRFPYLRNVMLYFEKPYVFISEVIGFIIVLHLGYKLFASKEFIKLLKWVRFDE